MVMMGGIPRRYIQALVGVELIIVVLATIFGAFVTATHATLPSVIYVLFVIVFCVATAVMWYLFVVKRPQWWGRQANPRRLKNILISAAVFAIFLEWGTLVGAPIASPFVLADWHLSRMAAFFVLSLPVMSCITMYDWRAFWVRNSAKLLASNKLLLKRFCFWVLAVVVVAAVTACISGLLCAQGGIANAVPYQVTWAVIAAVAAIFVGLRRSMAERPERGYLAVVLAAGMLIAVFTPYYTHISWDDQIHYDRAIATSYLVDPEYTMGDAALVGRAYYDVAKDSRAPTDTRWVDPYDSERLDATYDRINELGADNEGTVRIEGANSLRGSSLIGYFTVGYIPAAIGLWIGRLFALPTTMVFLLGRLTTLLCYALVTYFACKRLKSGKMLLAACALIPTSVFLGSGYSYDFWLISFLMLGFACFVGELQRPDEPLSWRRLWLMIGAFLLALGPKAVYVPIAAMLLFMPRKKFKGSLTHKRYLIIVFASAFFVLSTFLLPFFIAGPGSGDSRGGDVNPSAQIAFILQHPVAYLDVFWQFFDHYISIEQSEFILTDFCGIETAQCMREIYWLLPLVALTDRGVWDAAWATHAKRISMVALGLLTMLLISTALFIDFTPPDAGTILGVQGRYLLPLLFPVFLICFNFKPMARYSKEFSRRGYNYGVLVASGGLLFVSIAEVLISQF